MILYHGTSEYAALEALKHGLKPRAETGEDNWKELGGSNPQAIYLTDTYACHYAINARMSGPRVRTPEGKLSKRMAVIEIETSGLPFTNFRADEDYLAFTDPTIAGMMTEENLKARIAHHRRNLTTKWRESLATLGTCVYLGRIPLKHITRVALFDPRSNDDIAMAMADGLLSPAGFKHAGYIHRNLTEWLFGRELKPSDIIVDPPSEEEQWVKRREYWQGVIANRSGIEIINPQENS